MDKERMDNLCLSLKGTSQDIKWEDHLCYLVAEKMFCITNLEGDFKASLKVNPKDFSELVSRMGIDQAGYMAKGQWISITDPDSLSNEEWDKLIKDSYQLIFQKLTKKKQAEIIVLD